MTAYDLLDVRTSTGTAGLTEGESRENAAHVLLMTRRAVYVRQAQRALLAAALDAGTATADDVAATVELPPDIDGRLLGAAPGALARAGLLTLAGYVRSTRPTRRASAIAAWQLADRAAAQRWLAANPPLSELITGRQMLNDKPATVAAAAGSL